MTACNDIILCEKADTSVKVLAKNPGTADLELLGPLPSLAPYPGTMADLQKCPESAAADCEGNPLAGAVLTTATGLSDVDLACAPPVPACPVDGQITVDDKGITWQLIGGAWQAVAFTPACAVNRVATNTTNLDNDYLVANAGAGIQSAGEVCATLTNTDCVPWRISGEVRGAWAPVQLDADGGLIRVVTNIQQSSATGLIGLIVDGSPGQTFTTQNIGSSFDRDTYGQMNVRYYFNEYLKPGDTVEVCYRMDVNVQQYTSTNAANLIGGTAFTHAMFGERCLQL